MSDFRCPRYWWDGSQWRCENLPNDYLSSYDFDTYCTSESRCLECPYMDSDVREKVAAFKKEVDEQVNAHAEEQCRTYAEEQCRTYAEEQCRTYAEDQSSANKEEKSRPNTEGQNKQENSHTSSGTTAGSSSASSDTSSTGTILSLLFGIISFVFAIIVKVFPYIWWGSMTALVPLFVLNPTTFVAFLAIISIICHLAFYPYCVLLISYSAKKQITAGTMFAHIGKWFKKGPFAYKDIKVLTDSFKKK